MPGSTSHSPWEPHEGGKKGVSARASIPLPRTGTFGCQLPRANRPICLWAGHTYPGQFRGVLNRQGDCGWRHCVPHTYLLSAMDGAGAGGGTCRSNCQNLEPDARPQRMLLVTVPRRTVAGERLYAPPVLPGRCGTRTYIRSSLRSGHTGTQQARHKTAATISAGQRAEPASGPRNTV
jgi:hypothetical protein